MNEATQLASGRARIWTQPVWLPSPYVIVANAYIRKISKLRINVLRILFKKLGRNKSKMAPEKCKKKKNEQGPN